MEFRADVEHSAGGTRFASRAAALAVLDDRIALSLEQGTLLGVLVVRLLRLREFNILFGYELGQHLVEKAQQAIARVLRPADTVEQVGEGEFLLCLPELISANHALLAGQACLGPARTAPGFLLFDLGGFPGLYPAPAEEGSVAGEVWSVEAAALARLDVFEGVPAGLYRRGLVPLLAPFAARNVDAYFPQAPAPPHAPLGSEWRE